MAKDTLENYLKDLGCLVIEKAMEAKSLKALDGQGYNLGYLMAWHEIVSLMQMQAKAFNIPLSEIGLEGINPERDLL